LQFVCPEKFSLPARRIEEIVAHSLNFLRIWAASFEVAARSSSFNGYRLARCGSWKQADKAEAPVVQKLHQNSFPKVGSFD
jgi:hypothetical protein